MSFFDYLSNFNVSPVFILAITVLFGSCLLYLLASIFNKFETIEIGSIKLIVKSVNKNNLTELINIVKNEEERKQKEDWLNKKTSMELNLKTRLALARVWKRSSPEYYQMPTQKNGAVNSANSYNEMLIKYTNFCKSISEEPNPKLKYIIDIYNKGEDFIYGEEPRFFIEYSDNVKKTY